MKITLNQDIVLDKRFSLAHKPILKNGELDFEPNLKGNPYIVFDDNRKSPVGFGLKVGAGGKSYIIQRKVDGKVIKAKVGNVSLFLPTKNWGRS